MSEEGSFRGSWTPALAGFRLLGAWLVLAIAGCSDATPPGYQGYVEGEFVHVATSIGGRLEKLNVKRGDEVVAGAPLFSLESINESESLREAEARLKSSESVLADLRLGRRPPELDVTSAQLKQAEAEERLSASRLERDEAQFKIGGISQLQLDESRADHAVRAARMAQLRGEVEVAKLPSRLDQITAQEALLTASRAAMERARWQLGQKSVAAPRSGRVYETPYHPGDWVAAGSPVVRLLPPENVKIRFFVPQSVAAGISPGRSVLVDPGVGTGVSAVVDYVSTEAEFTPPVIFSNETSGKLVYRIEARTDSEVARRLSPGQPVRVRLP
jgi:HlyD family secretion protein